MLIAEVGAPLILIQLIKGEPAVEVDRAQISSRSGVTLEVDLKRQSDEVTILLSRFAVEQFCGLKGILFQLGREVELSPGAKSSELRSTNDTLQSEIVVKVLIDARVSREASPASVRDTALLLIREMGPSAALVTPFGRALTGVRPAVSAANVASCLIFIENALRRWDELLAGQVFVLELSA